MCMKQTTINWIHGRTFVKQRLHKAADGVMVGGE